MMKYLEIEKDVLKTLRQRWTKNDCERWKAMESNLEREAEVEKK